MRKTGMLFGVPYNWRWPAGPVMKEGFGKPHHRPVVPPQSPDRGGSIDYHGQGAASLGGAHAGRPGAVALLDDKGHGAAGLGRAALQPLPLGRSLAYFGIPPLALIAAGVIGVGR